MLCNLANATACLGLQDEAVDLARRAIELAPDATLPRRVLCNALPYRDGITGSELLAALKDCSDRLPRESLPPFANTRRSRSPARRRSAVGFVQDASGGLADGRRLRDAGSRRVRSRLPGTERHA